MTPRQPGAKAPGQRPTRPWRALLARRVGRWPLLCPHLPVYGSLSRAGGETQCVSCSRPETVKALSPPQWQGPSPLPQCYAAPLASRGPKPPASPPPATGGRFAPAGSGAGLRCAVCDGLCRNVPQGRGKRAAFPIPARRGGGTGGSHLNGTGRPRLLTEEILVTISPGACVLFSAWSCDRRKEIQSR